MDDSAASDSWKKLVISKNNDQWIPAIKTEQIDEDSAVTAAGFSLDYDPFSEVKSDATTGHSDQQCNEASASSEQEGSHGGTIGLPESPKQRSVRLAKMSAYAAQRLANETPEQRAVRLKRMSEYAAKRLANETSEQRAKRLSRMSAYAAKRLARETPEQRHERLTRMSAYAARRHAMMKLNSPSTSKRAKSKTDSASVILKVTQNADQS